MLLLQPPVPHGLQEVQQAGVPLPEDAGQLDLRRHRTESVRPGQRGMVRCPILHNSATMYVVVCCDTLAPVGLYRSEADAIRAGYACKELNEAGFQVNAMLPGEACSPTLENCVFESRLA